MSVPLLLAVVGGCILFLAVLIPAIFFICRYCCNKAPVGITDQKPRQQPQVSPLHTHKTRQQPQVTPLHTKTPGQQPQVSPLHS